MVDVSEFHIENFWEINSSRKVSETSSQTDAVDTIRSYGLDAPSSLPIGKLIRCAAEGDKGSKKSGWLIYNEFLDDFGRAIGIAVFGSWRGKPEKIAWSSRQDTVMSNAERESYIEQREQAERVRDEEKARVNADAANKAEAIWQEAWPVEHHQYLTVKNVQPFGARINDRGRLILDIRDEDGVLTTLQFIDDHGDKLFLTGGRKKGCFHLINGDPKKGVYICEGWATGASIAEATGGLVYVALDAGNLGLIVAIAKATYSNITICGDLDKGGKGQEKAIDAGAIHGCNVAFPKTPSDFNDMANADGLEAVREILFQSNQPEPVDPFGQLPVPDFPRGILPAVLDNFVTERAKIVGADPSGFAISTLAVCASVISDRIKVRVKVYDDGWLESARIWVAIIGDPSAKKSPIISETTAPLKKLQNRLFAEYKSTVMDLEKQKEKGELTEDEYQSLLPEPPRRLYMMDTTVEAHQEVISRNEHGMLTIRDELAGWLGGIDKYSGGKGASADQAYWLESWNGGPYTVDRVKRGAFLIPNLSVSLVGGIQPSVIAGHAKDMKHDGLMQRFLPVILQRANMGQDVYIEPKIRQRYKSLIYDLFSLEPALMDEGKHTQSVAFDDDAQIIRRQFAEYANELTYLDDMSQRFTAWAGKLDGYFARVCLIFHCVDAVTNGSFVGNIVPGSISADTAARVSRFFKEFLIPHGLRFYCEVLASDDALENARNIAGLILAQGWEHLTRSDLTRNYRPAKRGADLEIDRWLETLTSFGWLTPIGDKHKPKSWDVNPKVHIRFKEQSEHERKVREERRRIVLENIQADKK